MLYEPNLSECFGLGKRERRRECDCPSQCKLLCSRIRFDPVRSPRRRKKTRLPFTVFPNHLFEAWHPPGQKEPDDGVKATYRFLVTRTMVKRRWVVDPMDELAEMRGVSLKTLRRHVAALKKLQMILTAPFRHLSDHYKMNDHAILILDLPAWYVIPKVGDTEDERAYPHRGVDVAKMRSARCALKKRVDYHLVGEARAHG